MTGTLYGLGVGPGDPELLTLKALRVLTTVPVIAYPSPEHGDSLARQIVAEHLPGDQIEIAMRMPMVEARFPAQEVYDRATREIGDHLVAGRDAAVLCEGDPFFYGSFLYLFGRMAMDYRVEVVPGVSSLTACAAALGAPLSARNDVLTIVPATLSEDEIDARFERAEAVALVKLGRHFEKVQGILRRRGLIDRAHYIERATMSNQRVLPIDQVCADEVPYFSMILVHCRGGAWRM